MSVSLEQIVSTVRPVSFTDSEVRLALGSVRTRERKGSDLRFGYPGTADTAAELAKFYRKGLLFLFSRYQLKTGFLFVKLSAGKSLFGRQKAVYACYVDNDLGSEEWDAGPVFKMWPLAITSIGNVYRGYGLE